MARVDVVMPQMGESIAEGTLSKWLKRVGEPVKRDEPMFEISTDKVDAEIPAPASGVLAEILVKEGQTVPVQAVVARLETEVGAAVPVSADIPAPAAAKQETPSPRAVAASSQPAPAAVGRGSQTNGSGRSTPAVPGNGARSLDERLRTKSSPLVRRMAAEHGVDIGSLSGSGLAGRVTKRDFLQFLEGGGPRLTHDAKAAPLPDAWPGDVVEPMSKMRSLISEHMVVSRRTSAHVTSVFEIDYTRVARIRAANRVAFEQATGEKLTFLPFIISTVIEGLKAVPVLNAAVRGNQIIYRKHCNIGVAVALDWGLIVPVIKDAENLSFTGITRALNDLAARARAKRLDPRDVVDGTFTITNPGVFGSLIGTPIINQPQVGILCVGAIEKRPKVVKGAEGEDVIAIRTCGYLSLSFDHRIVDGSEADRFLAFVKKGIESFPEKVL